ncbi:hypothetical protein GXW82_24160 [Streptacidiphilus sp. 4-A2]|nr:hypothetical protein [Streptacidiphilus sp. 4-A2]
MSARRAPRMAVIPEALAVLGVAAVGAEVVLGLVGGLPAAASGAAVLVVAALLAARYIEGADAVDSNDGRKVRLVGSREPTLRYWDAAIEDARESLSGYELHLRPLLQRLYAVRLAERHGVSLHTDPARAASIVGAELWPWIDPARGRLTPGFSREPDPALRQPVPDRVIAALVDRLEQL